MTEVIATRTPLIEWNYESLFSLPQQSFRVVVWKETSGQPDDILWDTGFVTGSQTSVRYNFDGNASDLPLDTELRMAIQASDGLDTGTQYHQFQVQISPVIDICTVDNRLNPKNLVSKHPIFRWKYTHATSAPLTGYELRVGNESVDLGTDAFAGNVWRTEVRVGPNPHQSIFNDDDNAFLGCYFPKEIESGVVYYYQLRVLCSDLSSEWYTGHFRMNNRPTASDLQVLPVDPRGGDDLEAYYVFVDDIDEEESDKTEIRWYRNGIEVPSLRDSKTVPGSLVRPEQIWFFSVRPHDGTEFGDRYVSPKVGVANDLPDLSVIGISPPSPLGKDTLEAEYTASDLNNDNITIKIRWYKNGIEQPSLRDSETVSPAYTAPGDKWYFEATSDDGYSRGPSRRSKSVTIGNTRPRVDWISVDGSFSPKTVSGQNPVVAWRYEDDDKQKQAGYQVRIGSKRPVEESVETKAGRSSPSSPHKGIVSIVEKMAPGQGAEIIDTGIVYSVNQSYKRKHVSTQPVALGPSSAQEMVNFSLPDSGQAELDKDSSQGEVRFLFPGKAGNYEFDMEYVAEKDSQVTYELRIDGVVVDYFLAEKGSGVKTRSLREFYLDNNSTITVVAKSASADYAAFRSLRCIPIAKYAVAATGMELVGYVDRDDNSVGLASSEGFVRFPFSYAAGTYEVHVRYRGANEGTASGELAVGSQKIGEWSFEADGSNHAWIADGVSLAPGSVVKINTAASGGADAALLGIDFIPRAGGAADLIDGMTYYVSVRVFDGTVWSAWHVGTFAMKGSAWQAAVNNSTGWTVEFNARIFPVDGS